MKNTLLIILISTCCFLSCKQTATIEPEPELEIIEEEIPEPIFEESQLFGLWGDHQGEVRNTGTGLYNVNLIFGFYGNGIQLRENGEYAIHFQGFLDMDDLNSRVNGTWRLENGRTLILYKDADDPQSAEVRFEGKVFDVTENELILEYGQNSYGAIRTLHLRSL